MHFLLEAINEKVHTFRTNDQGKEKTCPLLPADTGQLTGGLSFIT